MILKAAGNARGAAVRGLSGSSISKGRTAQLTGRDCVATFFKGLKNGYKKIYAQIFWLGYTKKDQVSDIACDPYEL